MRGNTAARPVACFGAFNPWLAWPLFVAAAGATSALLLGGALALACGVLNLAGNACSGLIASEQHKGFLRLRIGADGALTVFASLAALMLASPDAGAFTGTLDKELIRKAMHAQWPATRRCFEQPNAASGKFVVRFVIGPDGRVTQSELAQPTTFSSGVVACVLKAVKVAKVNKLGFVGNENYRNF